MYSKLQKIKALHNGAKTDGEKEAASAAFIRVHNRLYENHFWCTFNEFCNKNGYSLFCEDSLVKIWKKNKYSLYVEFTNGNYLWYHKLNLGKSTIYLKKGVNLCTLEEYFNNAETNN